MIEEKARKSLATIATELPWAEGSSLLITNENGSNRLDLRVSTSYVSEAVVWSNTITYSVAPSTFDANHDGIQNEGDLVRTQNGITRTLCSAVVNGGFTATRVDDHVTLQLRLAQTDTHTASELASNASTVITLRN